MDTMSQQAAPSPSRSMSGIVEWSKAATVRAAKTAAQAAVAAVPVSAATIGTVDWPLVSGTAALAAVMSLLTSIAGLPEVDSGASIKQLAGK
ncbi:hypothetical protein BINDI_0903 [Bifidobacterium [indicum] DSM 20214 = LMG 11587]|uniref:Holin n=2 Tax=Bifidobacterium coryneforme TaxID=1687 RepID=A0A087VV00_9BIFI|nr:hypothetical protein BINDI_0903 [Bifidobacterium indicum LMG 11587 = DSM 20214]